MSENINNLVVQTIQDPNELPLILHSRVNEPVSNLSLLRKSLLFAELSMIAYNDSNEAERAVNLIGFPVSIFLIMMARKVFTSKMITMP